MSDQYPPYGQGQGNDQGNDQGQGQGQGSGHGWPGPYGQQPYGQQNPYGQNPYGQNPYGQQDPYGQRPRSAGEPPLWAPWYSIPFAQAFLRFRKKYVRFDGRASQSEFWFWTLWFIIGAMAVSFVGTVFGIGGDDSASQLVRLWMLACAIGFIALTVRRLHDANLSGLLALLFIIPPLGILFSLVIGLVGSNPQGQRYDRAERG